MKDYIILIDGRYYAGEGEANGRKSSGGGWTQYAKEQTNILLTNDKSDAKVMSGWANVNSHWKRIYDSLRYREITARKIEIVEVGGRE